MKKPNIATFFLIVAGGVASGLILDYFRNRKKGQ